MVRVLFCLVVLFVSVVFTGSLFQLDVFLHCIFRCFLCRLSLFFWGGGGVWGTSDCSKKIRCAGASEIFDSKNP